MAKFKIQIEELLTKVVEVEAETCGAAFRKVENDLKTGKINFSAEDLSEIMYRFLEQGEALKIGDPIPAEASGEI